MGATSVHPTVEVGDKLSLMAPLGQSLSSVFDALEVYPEAAKDPPQALDALLSTHEPRPQRRKRGRPRATGLAPRTTHPVRAILAATWSISEHKTKVNHIALRISSVTDLCKQWRSRKPFVELSWVLLWSLSGALVEAALQAIGTASGTMGNPFGSSLGSCLEPSWNSLDRF